jgi:hypothetical protein
MRMRTASQTGTSTRMAALGAALIVLTRAGVGHAEDVPATGKGIVGGALLGGEVVMLGEAAFRANSGWAYLIGGVVGAGGGGALGYLAEQNADSKVSVYMLAGGMTLIIPTAVAVLNATAYTIPDEYTTDSGAIPAGEPVPEPPQPGMSPVSPNPPATPAPAPQPTSWDPASPPRTLSLHYHWSRPVVRITPGLLAANEEGLHLSVPAVEVRPVYGASEMAKLGLSQQHQEVRMTVFSATF